MRLDKLIEESLQTSRKEMKRLFLRGLVTIDGQKTLLENRNLDSQIHDIRVQNKSLYTAEKYYLLNKPKDYVTANHDRKSKTVMDLLREEDQAESLYAVGRLDRDTEGLVLLTTNGPLGFSLLHPTKKVKKRYEVYVNVELTQEDVQAFAQGIVFHGGITCKPALLELGQCAQNRSQAWVTIEEGKFHQVKKMFLACGKKVIALKRIAMGPLELGDLALGEYRALTQAELMSLRPYFESEKEDS